MTIIIFIIVLAVLIFVHELGHFLAARWSGIRVDAFKIGFGPKLLAWKRGETEYGVNLIPFGGFVRIHGENPDDASLHGADAHRSFVNKNRLIQVIVLAAGVIFNLLFAWILCSVVFLAGITLPSDQNPQFAGDFTNKRIIISDVAQGSPAERAGLKPGDTIQYVETTAMNAGRAQTGAPKAAQTITDIQNIVGNYAGKPVAVEYLRNGYTLIVGVTPVEGYVQGKAAIGIGMENVGDLHLSPGPALVAGARFLVFITKETVLSLAGLVAGIFQGTANLSEVSGPVGIYGIIGDAARTGFVYVLMITALISVNLAIINIVPFPALDGGRILFVLIESITRKRIPHSFANAANAVGFVLLMILMVAITWKDVAGLITGK